MSNEIFLLYHSYEYGKQNEHEAKKNLGIYSSLKSASEAVNRYKNLQGFNQFPKKCFIIDKFTQNIDNYFTNGFYTILEPYQNPKINKYTQLYAEISCESKNISLIDDLNNIIKFAPTKIGKIGEMLKSKRIRDNNLWEFQTKIIKANELSKVSKRLCDLFYNIKDKLGEYVRKNSCSVNIYFVVDIGRDGFCIEIDEKLMQLALVLNSKISFDGLS